MSQRLMPGNYFIEMAFRRPVTEETLASALAGMGFTNVEFDKNDDAVVGGISITNPIPKLGSSKLTTRAFSVNSSLATSAAAKVVPVSIPTPQSSAVAATSQAFAHVALMQSTVAPMPRFSAPAALTRSVPAAPSMSIAPVRPIAPSAARLTAPAPSLSKSLLSSTAMPISPMNRAALSSFQPAPSSPVPTSPLSTPIATNPLGPFNPNALSSIAPYGVLPVSLVPPNGSPGGGTDGSSSDQATDGGSSQVFDTSQTPNAPTDPNYPNYNPSAYDASADPSASKTQTDPNNFSSTPHEAAASSNTDQTPSPSTEVTTSADNSAAKEEISALARVSTDFAEVLAQPVSTRWQRWVEWGSPFATTPAHLSSVSGTEDDDVTRFRFVATLKTSLTPTNLADMSWVFIRYLGVNPFADLNFQLTPFPLRRGAFYEFRFFSRLKANPTKDSVKETMSQMGFDPLKLNLLKKNMRIPHRGRVSVNMWFGMGRWNGPNSVVTSEDPIFIEALKEVQP